ncbi:MAG: acetate--CoA ligase family protein [Nitrospinae bacterium]|nr:acetate--CoA ligase family protein [Nitrospinota bacterium]MBI3814454.1 acetate--CoA ligase family protein [Nitrospinota bacterium]
MKEKRNNISFFFNPKAIAIIGASPTPGKLSSVILESLNRIGFSGSIYPVNPKYTSINDLKCYGSIHEIKNDIDIAVIALPSQSVLETLKDMAKTTPYPPFLRGNKVKGAIIVSAGFKETGENGRKLEGEIKGIVEKFGIRVMGPNCMGIYDTISKVDTFFVPKDRVGRPVRGGISIVSQSGSFAATIMDELALEGIGVSRVISYGNGADVDESDCLEFLKDDEATNAIALYIESVNDGRRFVEAAFRCTRKKPVVAVKVGRRDAGVNAARSHTGAMTGRYEIYRAAFKKAGVTEIDGYEGLKDACRIFNVYGLIKGKKVLIITDGGGIGVRIADACENSGLEVAGITEAARNRLTSRLPSFCAVGNPIDLTGSVTDEDYLTALEEGLKDGFDIAIMTVLWGPPQLTEGLVEKLKKTMKRYNTPIIVCSPGGEFTKMMGRIFGEKGIPVFSSPESAVRAAAILTGKRI